MAVTSTIVASGPGWQVTDVVCGSGPRDKPFEEQHDGVSIAAVMRGSFQYRTRQGSAVLVPGALLLGNAGACYQCGHEHAVGDRCLAFHMTPQCYEEAVAETAGARSITLSRASLPPLPQLVAVLADAQAARDDGDAEAFDELRMRLTGAVASLLAPPSRRRAPSAQDERRITSALRHIERHAEDKLGIAALARLAAMSPYHFLRTFRQVVGVTPHQFILRTRLYRAASRLRSGDEQIASIAFDCGFNDLSTFNRRFRRVTGVTPGDYRIGKRTA
ncbi:AraC family transcriptional regulator [Pseudolabrys sp. FHR47]|uniref:AraC family transcriptional regulator n=1 Tax=Pseudolabrys sp. FHR47 TaxID=2562284 RepID=UPI0010BEFAE5|nr:AraC family transcriptional regulator [Pseudolabrys sp. FHR47]